MKCIDPHATKCIHTCAVANHGVFPMNMNYVRKDNDDTFEAYSIGLNRLINYNSNGAIGAGVHLLLLLLVCR